MTMKKYLFLFAVCVSLALSSGQAYAQRYLPGMKGVELRGGFAGNLKSPVDWYTGFAVSGYTKRANHWVAGVEYLLKNYGYRGTFVPRAQFTAEGGYYLKFLSDPAKIFFLSVGGSALVGYETLNWGEKVLYDGSMLAYRDAFRLWRSPDAGAGKLCDGPYRAACPCARTCALGQFSGKVHDTVRD